MKICSACKVGKPIEAFHKQSSNPTGRRAECKTCRSKSSKAKYKSWRALNPLTPKVREGVHTEFKHCKDCEHTKSRDMFYKNNKLLDGLDTYCKPCSRKRSQKSKATASSKLVYNSEVNKARRRVNRKKWRDSEKGKEYMRKYKRNRLKTDTSFRLQNSLSCRVRDALKNKASKNSTTMELIGCSIKELKGHLEAMFTEGMTWNNYGYRGWHIDHKRPCASFDLTDLKQQKECFNYKNLQPLWAEDNMSKGSEYFIEK